MSAVGEVTTAVQDVAVVTEVMPAGDVILEVEAPDGEQAVQLTMPHRVWVALGSPQSLALTLEVRCRECGCTDSAGCFTGCFWAAPGLCSECA